MPIHISQTLKQTTSNIRRKGQLFFFCQRIMDRSRLAYPLSNFSRSLFSSRPSCCANVSSIIARPGSSKRGMADLPRRSSEPRVFPASGWDNVDSSLLIEEETIPTYRPEKFYPVRIGDIFNNRYQVVGKLGYGSSATVWLGRDLW